MTIQSGRDLNYWGNGLVLGSVLDGGIVDISWNQLSLQGTTMGNDHEFNEMLAFVSKHQIRPMIDSIRPFSKLADSFADIILPNKVGKIVFQL